MQALPPSLRQLIAQFVGGKPLLLLSKDPVVEECPPDLVLWDDREILSLARDIAALAAVSREFFGLARSHACLSLCARAMVPVSAGCGIAGTSRGHFQAVLREIDGSPPLWLELAGHGVTGLARRLWRSVRARLAWQRSVEPVLDSVELVGEGGLRRRNLFHSGDGSVVFSLPLRGGREKERLFLLQRLFPPGAQMSCDVPFPEEDLSNYDVDHGIQLTCGFVLSWARAGQRPGAALWQVGTGLVRHLELPTPSWWLTAGLSRADARWWVVASCLLSHGGSDPSMVSVLVAAEPHPSHLIEADTVYLMLEFSELHSKNWAQGEVLVHAARSCFSLSPESSEDGESSEDMFFASFTRKTCGLSAFRVDDDNMGGPISVMALRRGGSLSHFLSSADFDITGEPSQYAEVVPLTRLATGETVIGEQLCCRGRAWHFDRLQSPFGGPAQILSVCLLSLDTFAVSYLAGHASQSQYWRLDTGTAATFAGADLRGPLTMSRVLSSRAAWERPGEVFQKPTQQIAEIDGIKYRMVPSTDGSPTQLVPLDEAEIGQAPRYAPVVDPPLAKRRPLCLSGVSGLGLVGLLDPADERFGSSNVRAVCWRDGTEGITYCGRASSNDKRPAVVAAAGPMLFAKRVSYMATVGERYAFLTHDTCVRVIAVHEAAGSPFAFANTKPFNETGGHADDNCITDLLVSPDGNFVLSADARSVLLTRFA